VSGYVRIHRSLRGHPAFRNDAEAMAFAWMVMGAAWQLTRVRYKERLIVLQRGQLAVSQRDMARALDRDKAWVERLWKRLKSEAMIAASCEAGVAVITICNYNEFQAESNSREAVYEAPREAGARQGQGTEQVREEREEEESEAIASVSPRQPLREALSFWNENAIQAGWPQARSLKGQREKNLRNRLRENGLDGFKAAIVRARASPYLAGPDPPSWFTFDFILHAGKFQRLIEGNYDRRNSDNSDPTLVALREYQQLVGDVGSGFGSG
jgi:hypothetical protein